MRTLLLLSFLAVFPGCKKHAQPTLPQIPDSSQMGGGGNTELPQATVFHTIYRYSGHTAQVLAFYAPEMEKRGAKQEGATFVDGNLVHEGGFGSTGFATPKDPTQPGVWLAVEELPNETRIDVWESVPKPP